MNCPICDKKPVGFMGTFFLKGVGFKRATQGFFKCRHCDALLIQKKNESGMPQFEKPFWIVYSLFIVALFGFIWIIFSYLESTMASESTLFTIPVIVAIFLLLFGVMDWIRARYWILKETTYEDNQEELKSQKLSTKGLMAFLLFAVLAISSFIFLDGVLETLSLSATAYTILTLVYMVAVFAMAIGLLKYLSDMKTTEKG